MRTTSMAALLICSLPAARAENVGEKWANLDFRSAASANFDMAALYRGRPSVIVEYVAAMRHYKAAAEREYPERFASVLQPRDQPHPVEPWTWNAISGDSVRRLEEGRFQVSRGSYSGNWFTEFECIILEWPMFICDDGQKWRMSAPDPNTVIFGGLEYSRFQPAEPSE